MASFANPKTFLHGTLQGKVVDDLLAVTDHINLDAEQLRRLGDAFHDRARLRSAGSQPHRADSDAIWLDA